MSRSRYRFVTVDVFTGTQFAGNPLAVFPEAAGLRDEEMQQLAAEMNLSETCFILPPDDPANHARLRIFHRTAEMPFAGHPTIGSAFVLARESFNDADVLSLELKAGVATADLVRDAEGQIAGARIEAPQPLQEFEAYAPEAVAACLGLTPQDLIVTTHQPVRASTGVEFILVELTPDGLDRAAPVLDAFKRLAESGGHRDRYSLFCYARLGGDGSAAFLVRVEARMFAPLSGTWEDPGTGSASSILGALLLAHSDRTELHIESRQGRAMGRPCDIHVQAWRSGSEIRASVAGGCVRVLEGRYERASRMGGEE